MATQSSELIINGNTIKPGQRTTIMLPMPKLYDWTPLSLPVHVIRGKTAGPTLCVTAAIHGDEVNGIEIVRRLLKKHVFGKLVGTLIAIPIVNVYGFLNQDRYLMDRRDLNRAFPGSQKGSLAARLANLIAKEIISQSTHMIDLHTGSLHRANLPQIRADLDMPGISELAKSFNVPVILHATLRDGSMRQYADDKEIPFLLYEAGESLRFDELSIKTGVNGILNVMHELGMISMKKNPTKKFMPAFARSSYWIRAPHSGILRPYKMLGARVEEGELLAKIGNPTGIEEHKLISPLSGIIIGQSNLPLVHEGAALFHVACFKKLDLVAEHIEYLQESHSE
jgi:predicted deacylase